MTITFRDKSNAFIDKLVDLAWEHCANHADKWLHVRPRDPLQLINDKRTEDQTDEAEPPLTLNILQELPTTRVEAIEPTNPSLAVIAVDAGVVSLGELPDNATAFAIRGAAVYYPPNGEQPTVYRYNTGDIIIDNSNKALVFHYIGSQLGQEDIFVKLSPHPPYYTVKSGMGQTANQIQDRCRNFVEHMIHEEALAILKHVGGGILLIDGALSPRTYDTPETYTTSLLSNCRNNQVHAVAISKKTRILVAGRPISTLFNETPFFTGYVPLSTIIDAERQSQNLGRPADRITAADEIFAVRFSFTPPGLTFRADVHPAYGKLPSTVLQNVHDQCEIYGGYPRPLIEAHQYSSFMFQDVQSLLANIVAKTGLHPQEPPSMEILFQPFGAKNK